MKASQCDVARAAAVSGTTVSRVVNNSGYVEEHTRQRVLKAIRDLGYVPSAAGRTLSRQRSEMIGVVLHQISSGFFASILDGIDRAARAGGYHILSAISHDSDDEREICLSLFKASRVDGLILADSALGKATLDRLQDYPQPFVLIECEPPDPTINTVSVHNAAGAHAAMTHLLSLGYRDILVLHGHRGAQDADLRLQGCRAALRQHAGPAVTCRYTDGGLRADAALAAFRGFRAQHGLPRAIFALNDTMAIAVLKELRRTGVRVPQDVAVVGFDGDAAAEHLDLTTVEMPMAELGAGALRLLMRRIEQPGLLAEQIRLPARLVVRETCGACLHRAGRPCASLGPGWQCGTGAEHGAAPA